MILSQHQMKQPAESSEAKTTKHKQVQLHLTVTSNCLASRRLNLSEPTFAGIDPLPLALLICKDFSEDLQLHPY
jgi:hypothetical protein